MTNNSFSEIKKVLDIFLEGTKHLDYDMMTSVVHPDGQMFLGEQSESKLLYEHWQNVRTMTEQEKKDYASSFRSEILSIEVVGSIACAKTMMNNWIDFLSLIKVDDDWKIVTKVSHKRK
nr:putative lumazine-binding protein [Candidatus Heimdallarchaeota archaeon]